jgi:sporulation protein YlmC with PRC-barrel domain
MKPTLLFITAALMASCLCLTAQGASPPTALKYGHSEKFAELAGTEVWNLQNEKLGKVKYVTVDLENGRVVEVVVTSGGGFLGIGAKYTAVAPRAFTFDEAGQLLRLNASKAKFAAAPRFDRSHMDPATARDRVAEVDRYYGLQPWFYLDGQKVVKNAQILPLGPIKKLSEIIDLPISSAKRGYLGEVVSVITNLPKGQVAHVIAGRTPWLEPTTSSSRPGRSNTMRRTVLSWWTTISLSSVASRISNGSPAAASRKSHM